MALEQHREMAYGKGSRSWCGGGDAGSPTLGLAYLCTTEAGPRSRIFSLLLPGAVRLLTNTRRLMVSHKGGGPLPDLPQMPPHLPLSPEGLVHSWFRVDPSAGGASRGERFQGDVRVVSIDPLI